MAAPNRRRFLCVLAGTGVTLTGGAAWLLNQSARSDRDANSHPETNGQRSLQEVKKTSWALGADVSILALHTDRRQAQAAVDSAFDELELVEQVMSLYRPESQLCRLNRDSVLRDPHPYLVEVLRLATDLSRRTEGAFDVTVQPLWALHAAAKQQGKLPSRQQIETARQKIDWRRIEISSRQIQLRGNATEVSLNGIAQGFAADRAMLALRRHGVKHALVDTGEIGSLGKKTEDRAWTVGIQHPRHDDSYLGLTKLAGRCLATSGDYETPFSDDYRVHHIFDPRTGRSPQRLSSVSVAANTAVEADALSTAIFVLGPQRGIELVRSTSGADALLVLKDGATKATDGFPLES